MVHCPSHLFDLYWSVQTCTSIATFCRYLQVEISTIFQNSIINNLLDLNALTYLQVLMMNEFSVFQLPTRLADSEIALLVPMFSPNTLETVVLQHFGVSVAETSTLKTSHRENTEGFKRDLLIIFRNKGHSRQVI